MLRAPVAACSLAALFALHRLLLLCVFSRFSAVVVHARRSKRSPLKALSGGAERTREASRERLACWLDALADLAALALLLLPVLALWLFIVLLLSRLLLYLHVLAALAVHALPVP